jgi:polysaccharide export outer membrane protein
MTDHRNNFKAPARWLGAFILCTAMLLVGCSATGDVVKVTQVSAGYDGLDEKERATLKEIKEAQRSQTADNDLKAVIETTPNYSVTEYLQGNPEIVNRSPEDYRVGGDDAIDIIVYEEPDLTRQGVRVSTDGYISFPLVGRIPVAGLTTSEIEERIATELAKGQFLLDAHVSVTVVDYKSQKFMVLGSVKAPGTYPLQGRDRVLDAISKAGGIDFEQGGNQGLIIRTIAAREGTERKITIRIDLSGLLKGGDQVSNLLLLNRDLLYIPKPENFYIIGQVNNPGSYPYIEKSITVVEAISKAGGFTQIAARNRTRIIRIENGREKIIEIKVDSITDQGKKTQDILIQPGDVIMVPESFF